MKPEDDGRCPSVADVAANANANAANDASLSKPAVSCCRACQRDGHGNNHARAGRLRPGHTWNSSGRKPGSRNDTTVAAAEILKANAREAVNKVLTLMRDPNPYVSFAAAKAVLEKLPKIEATTPDTSWIAYASEDELEQLFALIASARQRQFLEEVVAPAPAPAPSEAVVPFTLDTLPAPDDDDSEEFGQ